MSWGFLHFLLLGWAIECRYGHLRRFSSMHTNWRRGGIGCSLWGWQSIRGRGSPTAKQASLNKQTGINKHYYIFTTLVKLKIILRFSVNHIRFSMFFCIYTAKWVAFSQSSPTVDLISYHTNDLRWWKATPKNKHGFAETWWVRDSQIDRFTDFSGQKVWFQQKWKRRNRWIM